MTPDDRVREYTSSLHPSLPFASASCPCLACALVPVLLGPDTQLWVFAFVALPPCWRIDQIISEPEYHRRLVQTMEGCSQVTTYIHVYESAGGDRFYPSRWHIGVAASIDGSGSLTIDSLLRILG